MAAITGKYEYRDASGNLLYWKERIEPGRDGESKEFCFRHGNGKTGRGGEPCLYNLQDVIRSKAIIITEGEKQSDILKGWGLAGTSLDSGAGSKLTSYMIDILVGKRVAILRDNDSPGLAYATRLAEALFDKCESVRIVLLSGLPEKGDLCDWAGDRSLLLDEIKATPEYAPLPKVVKEPRRVLKTSTTGDVTPEMILAAKQYPLEKIIDFKDGKAPCFSHKEKTASLVLNAEKNKCHCFGCGGNWDSIDVLQSINKISFSSAVRALQ